MSLSSNSAGTLDRRFLRCVLELALGEVRRSQKDYLGAPHLFLALLQLEDGCTQDALDHMGFSSIQVGDTFRLAPGSGKAAANTPILPTRRCKEILEVAERIAIDARATSIDERAIAQASSRCWAGTPCCLPRPLSYNRAVSASR